MKMKILDATENPVSVISLAAGCSYGNDNESKERVRRCSENDHMSVFEHAHVTLKISGISRSCCDQLTRHRVASFVVQSQRYTKPDASAGDWFVTPPWFEGSPEYREMMANALNAYEEAIKEGAKYEDARFLLPMATKTEVVMTVNVRELFHMFDLRLDKAAQWEIWMLFDRIKWLLAKCDEQWGYLMTLYEEGRIND